MSPSPPSPPSRSILAATALDESSDAVLRAAAAFAAVTGAGLHVLHAFDLPPSPYMEHYADALSFPARIEAAEAALDAQVERVVPPGVRVVARRVEVYAAHRAIAEYARAVEAELVVIGAHARRGLELPFLGGTADRLVRTLEVPCLVVRGEPRMPLRRVVVPMDLSEWAREALETAMAWAGSLGVHRGEPGSATTLSVVHVVPVAVEEGALPEWERELERVRSLAPPGMEVRETLLHADRPAEAIVEFARREAADLVVMATHGYGAVRRALLGSTAQGVTRAAPCPVLLIPPRMWKEEE
jgi:nucleotide-binding universal stress UspA family protein